MQEKWRNLIRRLDAAIFSHQVVEVRKELLKIVARGRIPRAAIADIANQCRRVDLPEHAVSLLNRYVRPHGKIPARPSEFEKCEYAASLSQLGAHSEAAKLLEGNPNPSLSQWLFVQGMVYQKLWDFDRAIACFERALFHPKVRTGRGVLSIKTHLAAALIRARGDYDRADLLLEDVMNETSPTELGFLHRLAQMYGAEGALMRGRPQECLDRVAEGLRLYPEQNPRHEALSEGFASLAQLMLDPVKSLDSLRRVRAARDRLAELQAWEDGRLIAYHEAMIRGNRELFLRLYFGSPFPELQKRLLPKIQEMGGMPVDFDWYLTSPKNGKGEGDRYVLDVVSGAHSGGEDRLKTGQLLQRVLQALGSDPFRRFRIGDLFDRVFPGEYYNPHTAPDRIHQGVMRLRRWFE
ncbi:MAG TPA: hypothetical protein VL588_07205, partial [Bdellovibrionota bacterium]|nr:hypothetical protein [Bdellovibrionota bacterium]